MIPDAEDRLPTATRAAGEVFELHRERLKRMIRLLLDRRLQGRLDASDVLQEAFLDVQKKAADFAQRNMTSYLWLRLITSERLLILHRQHLGAEMRDVSKEVSLCAGGSPAASTHSLANLLLGRLTSPTQAAYPGRTTVKASGSPQRHGCADREVLALRHFEELTNTETADVLGLTKTAASNRYIRALKRLKEILATHPSIGS